MVGNEARKRAKYHIRKDLYSIKNVILFSSHLVYIQFPSFFPPDTEINLLRITITCVFLLQDYKFLQDRIVSKTVAQTGAVLPLRRHRAMSTDIFDCLNCQLS